MEPKWEQTRGGAELRAWLKAEGKTQEWLADQIKTHQTNVSAWILGRPISIEAAVAIRGVTEIPVEHWIVPASESSRSVAAADQTGPQLAVTDADAALATGS